MPKLLVSVRSAAEARTALEGGAAIVDVKEPGNGPLGRADPETWRSVVREVAGRCPVSVALGELSDRFDGLGQADFQGLAFRKVGLAGSFLGGSISWQSRWAELRERLGSKAEPAWVAVAYADWQTANAPSPAEVLDEALSVDECRGVLVDTWDKSKPSPVDESWRSWFARVRTGGRFSALAGSVTLESIERLRILEPDIIAVRGGVCIDGDRRKPIDLQRVRSLSQALSTISV